MLRTQTDLDPELINFQNGHKKPRKKINVLKPIFNNHPITKNWSVDTEDIDNAEN